MLTNTLLDGFEFITSDNPPALTLDRHGRIYINKSVTNMLNINTYDRLSLAYNPVESEIAIVKQSNEPEARASLFVVDKRNYLHVRKFVKQYRINVDSPLKFEYNRGASNGNVFVFRRQ